MAKRINAEIGADISGLQAGLKAAANSMDEAGKKMSGAAESMTTKTEGSVKNLQQAYRAAYKDAQILAQQQGVNSEAFLQAAKEAGAYKNQLGDVSEITKAMSSDTPVLTASLGVAQGLAGAFAAAQGAMALFGTDSKELQETMIKLQGAIALVSGLQALGGLADSFTALKAVVTTSVIPAITTLNTVIMANPFIALSAAIVAVAGAIYLYTNRVKDNTEALDANIKLNQQAKTAFEKLIDFRINSIKNIDLREQAQLKEKQRRERQELDREFFGQAQYNEMKLAQEKMFQVQLTELLEKQAKNREQKTKTKAKAKSFDKSAVAPELIGEDFKSNLDGLGEAIDTSMGMAVDAAAARHNQLLDQVKETRIQVSEEAMLMAAGLSAAIGAAIMAANEGGNIGEALISSVLGSMGDFLVTWGTQLIAVGIGAESLKAALASLQGVAAIAAGVALVALGGAAKATASSFSKNQTVSGSGVPNTQNQFRPGFQPTALTVMIDGRIKGSDIVIASYNTDRKNKRVK